MRTFLTSRRNDIKSHTRRTFLELESCASIVSVDGACHTVMEHEDHRVLEVSSAMVTHSVSVPVFLAPRGLCSMFLKSFFLGAADYGIRILPATLSFSLTARKTYWGKL